MNDDGRVTLICWSCGGTWTMRRRQGQYPNRCLDCSAGDLAAHRLTRRARGLGLTARVVDHARQGTVCMVATPWHDLPVIIRDDHDLRFLLNELGHQAAAARIDPYRAAAA